MDEDGVFRTRHQAQWAGVVQGYLAHKNVHPARTLP